MKIYKITFNKYTNALGDTISKTYENGNTSYISLTKCYGDGYIMIMTDDIGKYIREMDLQEYGNGIKPLLSILPE